MMHLPLMVWLSPAFPVGAFAYSHGLEWAHEAGDVTNAASLEDWLAGLLAYGAVRNDAILFAAAYRAADAGDGAAQAEIAELALALATSEERRLEATTQGDAFVAAVARSWPCCAVDLLKEAWSGPVVYPVAVAAAAAGHGIPLEEALEAFALGFVANLVSAAVRLGVVGQTDGQRVVAALVPPVRRLAAAAQDAGLDDLGGCAFRSDLAALRHETQYTRLFRS
jgi:urease accessory protein